ncbi:hypothetical protein Afil01_22560 [Actinorhabdospora filicis]|uniref:Uncharacterized protein n=2 Tax=Actinorhabdospora filicis TaxID=1785913 RepID=A0A9W6W8C3_9ACTN|nr:hypothetical protein Afil01_22560 [Actinorhabdospora filicis]
MSATGLPYWLPGVPPKRSKWGRRVGLMLMVVVLAAGSLLVGAIIGRTPVQLNEALDPVPPRPSDSASDREWENYVGPAALALLKRQSEALLKGDEKGWLAPYDADDKDLIKEQRDRYASLRNLQVTNWQYRIDGTPDARSKTGGVHKFDIDLVVGYCFGASDPKACLPTDVYLPTKWEVGADGPHITGVDESPANQAGPRPFEVSDLVAESGDRVIVAAPPQYKNRLSQAVDVAEKAAENADKYARWQKVDRYVVFLAGEKEFSQWYGTGDIGQNVVGFALPLGSMSEKGVWQQTGIEVVMHVERLGNREEFTSTMRHEFGHVVTLLGSADVQPQPEDFFLNEGIAEYIDYGDGPVSRYPRLSNVTDYLSRSSWNGSLEGVKKTDDGLTGSAKYGIAFMAVKYLIDTYGQDKFFEFYQKVGREGEAADGVSSATFGESWTNVQKKIEDYVRSSA